MFLSHIASSMLRYKRYPNRDDYVSVSCAVIQAYPFLKATAGRPYVSSVNNDCLYNIINNNTYNIVNTYN